MLVDTDGHVMEPASTWADHIESRFRDTCVRVVRDSRSGDKLFINGAPSKRVPRLGGVRPAPGAAVPDWNHLDDLSFYEEYADSCIPASYDGPERLRWMDANDIGATLLFPSLGLLWPKEAPADASYVRANMFAYNRWLLALCSSAPKRLFPVAQSCVFDLAQAVADLRELRSLGFQHVMLPWSPDSASTCFHPAYESLWPAAEDLGLTFHLHKIAIPQLLTSPSKNTHGTGRFFEHVNQTLPGQLCLASLIGAGVPDIAPRLRFAVHECNAGWVGPWLDRADESFETCRGSGGTLPRHPPSHYVLDGDRFFFGMSISERPDHIATIWRHVTAATDFPHPGSAASPGSAWPSKLAKLSQEARSAVLYENAVRLIGR